MAAGPRGWGLDPGDAVRRNNLGPLDRVALLAALILALLCLIGCRFNERDADTFARHDAHFPRNFWKGLALYIPNRLVDFVDMVHAGVGIGLLGTNVELHPTRYARLGAGADMGVGLGWLGRFTEPWEANMYARAVAGENEAVAKEGPRKRIPRWDVGVRVGSYYAGIAPDEVVDFFAGLAAFDLKGDDWGTGL